MSKSELEKFKKDTLVFDGDNCVRNALGFRLKLKGEQGRTSLNNKVAEYNLQLHAHNGSGFDTRIILNNLPCDKHIVDIFKNCEGISSLRLFIGYIHNGKKTISSISNVQMWYDTFKLFFEETRKDIQITKRMVKKRNEPR